MTTKTPTKTPIHDDPEHPHARVLRMAIHEVLGEDLGPVTVGEIAAALDRLQAGEKIEPDPATLAAIADASGRVALDEVAELRQELGEIRREVIELRRDSAERDDRLVVNGEIRCQRLVVESVDGHELVVAEEVTYPDDAPWTRFEVVDRAKSGSVAIEVGDLDHAVAAVQVGGSHGGAVSVAARPTGVDEDGAPAAVGEVSVSSECGDARGQHLWMELRPTGIAQQGTLR